MKLVSIVLPTYNGSRFLRDSIESVICQSYSNWELIIVNDCSTDETLSIANEYANKDNRIRVISNPINKRLPASLNVGFNEARGNYYTWTSDDNVYKRNAIAYMVKFLDDNTNIDLVSCNMDYADTNLNISYTLKDLLNNQERAPYGLAFENQIGACFMYTREIAQKVGEYDTSLFCAEDYDYWCRIAQVGKIAYSNENLYIYRLHQSSLSSTKQQETLKKTKEIWEKHSINILRLAGYDKKQMCKLFLNRYYQKEKNKMWLVLAKQVHPSYSFRKRLHYGIKNLFLDKKARQIELSLPSDSYKKAKNWINQYTVTTKLGSGIAVDSNQKQTIYPEVTGYYIPTLLRFGFTKLATSYASYLLSIQNKDGSWNDPSGKTPYTFDTGMILKGLFSLIEKGLDTTGDYKIAFLKGADWILSRQRENGSISTPDYSAWELPYGKRVPESIHIYCLEPLKKASQLWNLPKYAECVERALKFYLEDPSLTDFLTLSHFNAYIIEGLIDLGETSRAQRAMDLISLHQRFDGTIPAYSNVNFVCSTGLLQYSICWYKLGEVTKADAALYSAINFQNESGGWYGSYGEGANYFPQSEIAWAVKYFLDSIHFRQIANYRRMVSSWSTTNQNDECYKRIEFLLAKSDIKKILDFGCAQWRYSKCLIQKYPNKLFCGVDITDINFNNLSFFKELKTGTILNIPYPDNFFDAVFLTDSLARCIDLQNAISEISRVANIAGRLIIIDKDIETLDQFLLSEIKHELDRQAPSKNLEIIRFSVTE